MKTKFYVNNEELVIGTTLKDLNEPEQNNMALHICDSPVDVINNRLKLVKTLHCGIDSFVCANQTHSANVHKVTIADKGKGAQSTTDAIENTDALYTYEPNILLCTFTADCVPVIFYNKNKF